jgi:hypothetical protein
MQAQLQAVLQQQQQTPTPTPTQQPEPQGASSKDISDFGSDMVEMVQRVAQSVHASLAGRLDHEISKLRTEIATLTGRQQLTAGQQFDKDLLEAVPDWQEVDASPAWLTWLGDLDAFTGIPRQHLLTDAHQNLDVKRVAAIFKAYKASITPAAAPVAEPTAPPASTTKSELERQVAPSKASANATPTQPTQSIWTDASIQAFYRDQALGKFKGREAEMNQIEADLNAAIAEGRYRPR